MHKKIYPFLIFLLLVATRASAQTNVNPGGGGGGGGNVGCPNTITLIANDFLTNDGTNCSWAALAAAPANTPAVSHQWINSFASGPGTFGQSQPATTDLSDISTFSLNTSGVSNTFTGTGAASTSVMTFTGTGFAGTGTTSFPLVYFNCNGSTAPTTFSTSGVVLGFNTCTGFAGSFIEIHANGGAAIFRVNSAGTTISSQFSSAGTAASAGLFRAASGDAWDFRNAANTANVIGLSKGADDIPQIGDTAGGRATYMHFTNGMQTVTGADYTNATTTPSTVFSWTLPATTTAQNYRYYCDILWESTAATLVGPVFGVNISAAPTQLTAAAAVQNTLAGADVNGYLSNTTTGSQTLVTSGAAGVTSTNYWAKIWGTIEGAPTAGSTFIINAASTSGTTASLNIRRGSGCTLIGN